MLAIYHEIIYRPLLNLLVFFYNIIPGHDMGVVIILLTIVIRILLAPIMHKSLKSQKQMNALQPKLNALRETHKHDKQAQAKAMMDLYKEHKINPASSCLPILLQLPVFIALYQVFRNALGGKTIVGLYSFVHNPGAITPKLFNIVDLTHPSPILVVLSGLLQFWQSKMMMSQNSSSDPTAKAMNIQMTYVLPVIQSVIIWRLPAGLPLYFVITTLFSIAQQYYIIRQQENHSNI